VADVLELVIRRRLSSPNLNLWKHWSEKSRETKAWLAAINDACIQQRRWREWLLVSFDMQRDALGIYTPVEIRRPERRRVSIIRQVKYASHFIRDDDNLRFATKPVNDALKRAGLLFDDSRDWLDQAMPVQEVSPDKTARTIVRIERVSQEGTHAA
jgi:Holliday junction resolvase RusA-like endonuclease